MRVSEIFYSVQGEGLNVGKPAIFIRTAGCNMRPICEWCDSKYALKNGKEVGINEVVLSVQEIHNKTGCGRVVITGGEPCVQIDLVLELINNLPDFIVEIETNGLIYFDSAFVDVLTISPKKQNYNFDNVLRFLNDRCVREQKTIIKFVVANEGDFYFWHDLVRKSGIDRMTDNIYMMPEGVEDKQLKKNSLWLVELCKQHNFNYSPRLQIYLYGNKRGV